MTDRENSGSRTERLDKLLRFWYAYVSCEHHKDRDCHFEITKRWSYGSHLKYYVVHEGYRSEIPYEEFDTYEEALDFLISSLEDEIKSAHRVPKNWEEDNWDFNWKDIIKVCTNYNLYPIEYYGLEE